MPEDERSLWVADWALSSTECSLCGRPRSECSDPEPDWFPQRAICHPTMERLAAERKYEMLHAEKPYHDGSFKSWRKERSDRHPYHFKDGVTIYVAPRDLHPEDDFLGSAGREVVEPHDGGDD